MSGPTDKTSNPNVATWCPLCGTQHVADAACPRQTEATGPEMPRWRVGVETPQGIRGYGVLVAEAGARWRSRIVTFPNILWMVPGGGETLKFLCRTESEAVRKASDFIRQHCVAKGYLMRDEVQFVEPSRSVSVGGGGAKRHEPVAPRFERCLPVRFGRSRPTIVGQTRNLSESGIFVATPTPLTHGEQLGLSLELEHCKVPLRGAVAWNRVDRAPGRDPGMGLRLVNPPPVYVQYVRALA